MLNATLEREIERERDSENESVMSGERVKKELESHMHKIDRPVFSLGHANAVSELYAHVHVHVYVRIITDVRINVHSSLYTLCLHYYNP